jgi:hypothetical protein
MPPIDTKNKLLGKPIFTLKPTSRVYLGKIGNTQHIVMEKNFGNAKSEVITLPHLPNAPPLSQ